MRFKIDTVMPEDERPPLVTLQIEHALPLAGKSPKTFQLTADQADELARRLRRAATALRGFTRLTETVQVMLEEEQER